MKRTILSIYIILSLISCSNKEFQKVNPFENEYKILSVVYSDLARDFYIFKIPPSEPAQPNEMDSMELLEYKREWTLNEKKVKSMNWNVLVPLYITHYQEPEEMKTSDSMMHSPLDTLDLARIYSVKGFNLKGLSQDEFRKVELGSEDIALLSFDYIQLNENKTFAIVHIGVSAGFLSGSGSLYKLRKENNSWIIINHSTTWVS